MPNKKKPITVDELWKVERVSSAALSPDGAQAVCTVSSYSMDDNRGHSALWLLSTFGGAARRLTSCGDKDGQAAWSPGGQTIAFLARREQQGKKDATAQLYLIAPDGGEAQRLSDFAPGIDAFKWFPDGRRIAFLAWVWPELKGAKAQARRFKEFKDRKETGVATSEGQYRHWDAFLPTGRVRHLHVIDVSSGRITDLMEGSATELPRADADAHCFDISPDGRHIAFVFDPGPQQQVDHCHALAELNLRSGKIDVLVRETDWNLQGPRYSPDGARIAFVANQQGKRHTLPGHAAVLRRGGRWQRLSEAWDRDVNAPLRWAADASALYFTAEDQGRCHLYRYAIESRSAAIVVQGGWVQGFDVAHAAGQDVCVSAADAATHPVRVQVHRSGQAAQRIERFNDALTAGWALGLVQDVRFKGALGDAVQMWLVYPPGFDPNKPGQKKLPLLHSIHGGPHAAYGDTFHYRWNSQAFAAQGYVVAGVNYHGSSGFGHAFTDSITHRFGALELQDLEAATEALLKAPYFDRRRVFAAGGSYGGYLVAWMNAHARPGRYSAYVCHAGCFDWSAMYADDCYPWFPRELGANYWDDMDRVLAQSPHAHAKSMRTPTLVVHGALDYRVPDAQGLAYYNTLKGKGVDARLLWFPDENHWILKPRNSRLWYTEFFAWLARHDSVAQRKR